MSVISAFRRSSIVIVIAVTGAIAGLSVRAQEGFTFKSGVDLVNVTATVTGEDGRFVAGLMKDDFTIYDNGQAQPITHFNNDRVPVSLGIALDTSGSMTEAKMASARAAINRLITDLLHDEDELFFMEFADKVVIRQAWTTDRRAISRAVSRVSPGGGTAMYDAIAEALPLAAMGKHRKKALLVISDGNDSGSDTTVFDLRQRIRESEVLVYALGVDGNTPGGSGGRTQPPITTPKPPIPIPFPGPRTLPGPRPRPFPQPRALPQIILGGGRPLPAVGERVNVDALRQITDDTGGRTEIIRDFRDLDTATARIADELSQQYSLGYASPGARDGRWHTIRVEVQDPRLTVRARRGYTS